MNRSLRPNQWSVVLPYFNEEDFLEATLRSWLAQRRPPDCMVLVDNASSDRGPKIARRTLQDAPFEVRFLREAQPGKVHALQTACAQLDTEFVAVSDADCHYPPDYLERLDGHLRSNPDASCALAFGFWEWMDEAQRRAHVDARYRWSQRHPTKCFTGGYAQSFRTKHLLEGGGFSADRWPYVVEDHEIIYVVSKLGRIMHCPDTWCVHTHRRKDRSRVAWTLLDRMLYRHTPNFAMGLYFYRFLAPRLARRGMFTTRLREKPWQTPSE